MPVLPPTWLSSTQLCAHPPHPPWPRSLAAAPPLPRSPPRSPPAIPWWVQSSNQLGQGCGQAVTPLAAIIQSHATTVATAQAPPRTLSRSCSSMLLSAASCLALHCASSRAMRSCRADDSGMEGATMCGRRTTSHTPLCTTQALRPQLSCLPLQPCAPRPTHLQRCLLPLEVLVLRLQLLRLMLCRRNLAAQRLDLRGRETRWWRRVHWATRKRWWCANEQWPNGALCSQWAHPA